MRLVRARKELADRMPHNPTGFAMSLDSVEKSIKAHIHGRNISDIQTKTTNDGVIVNVQFKTDYVLLSELIPIHRSITGIIRTHFPEILEEFSTAVHVEGKYLSVMLSFDYLE